MPAVSSESRSLDAELEQLVNEVNDAEDPIDLLNTRIDGLLNSLTSRITSHRPERIVELARVACLPWVVGGVPKPDTDGGPPKAELLTLLALVACTGQGNGSARKEIMNGLYHEAHEWVEVAGSLIHHAQMLLTVKSQGDPLAQIAASVRGREVWVRNTSYPDMVKGTQRLLFNDPTVTGHLRSTLGFDADDATRVLEALAQVQSNATNARWIALNETVHSRPDFLAGVGMLGMTSEEKVAFNQFWQPTADLATFTAAEVDELAGVGEKVTRAVLEHFTVAAGGLTSRAVLDGFVTGDNPLRINPLVCVAGGRYILVHDALIHPAIRENLEQTMRRTAGWEPYQARRGAVLEDIGKSAFERMLPGTQTYFGFDYFIPANEAEQKLPPAKYTKRVEGDMLFVLDDVAIIVEAKAVAITPAARAGHARGLRHNLTDMITRAASQANRARQRIQEDGGLRLRKDGWIDLSHVREIHTVALTLEDLTQVATATTALVDAGMLDADDIPWLVSIHDLQVIVDLVERPADFLLYLRRRRDPEMPSIYSAVDELDLFVFYLDAGLYVEPDPHAMAAELIYASLEDGEDLQRREQQRPTWITPRTESLDAWHQSTIDPRAPRAPKPHRTRRPMDRLVDELAVRADYGWLSIGATLLSGSTGTQTEWARVPRMLLSAKRGGGAGRSFFAAAGNRRAESWALIWVTRPRRRQIEEIRAEAQTYVRDKKYQTGAPRGAVFVFDEVTRQLIEVVYDGDTVPHSAQMDAATSYLQALPGQGSSRRQPSRAGVACRPTGAR
ncbi:hypothetical protein LG315_08330 [Microbacterium marinum]|uniref:hypothetical protein n=1 Tax=Microbacterium marinum TaxID=421115 RepID=UPI00384B1FE3